MNWIRCAVICWLAAMPAFAESAPTESGDKPSVVINEIAGEIQPIEFRFVVKPGDIRHYRITTQTFGTMTMFGPMPPQKLSQKFEQEFKFKCLRVNADGSFVSEMTFPGMAMQMNLGGMNIDVDTRSPSTTSQPVLGAIERIFAAISKVKCQVTFSGEGEPLKVEGLSESIDKMVKQDRELMATPNLSILIDRMKADYLGDHIIEENLRSSYRLFPDGKKARLGDKWTREWEVKLPGFKLAATGKAEYELVSIESFRGRPCARIRIKFTLNTVEKPKPAEGGATGRPLTLMDRLNFKMNSSGSSGTAYVDYETGVVVQLRETQRVSIETSMDSDAQEAGRQGIGKLNQNLTTSVVLELLEDAEPAPANTNGSETH